MVSQMSTKTINNVTVNYLEKGTGTPIVLMHGFPLDSRVWEAQVNSLSDQYRVIAPDLRGFGKSASSDAFSMASLADDVHALLKEIGALPAVLGGLSMGGYVALAFAKKYPADLRGLLMVDTRAEADTSEGKEKRNKMIQLVRDKGSKAVADEMSPKMLAEETAKAHPAVGRKLREIMESQSAKTIEHAVAAMRDREDHTKNLASIAVPTLIIVGESDAITPPAMSQSMNQAIRNSTLVTIKSSGHMSPMEQPEQVSNAIRGFVAKLI
jgi:pimeloyl-ACP methyl ester carboxylesterase